MRLMLTGLAWIVSAAVLAPVCFFGAIILAGPHSSMLPSFMQPAVLVLFWIVFLAAPIMAARVVWRRLGRVAATGAVLALAFASSVPAQAQEIRVMTSGGLAAPYVELVPAIERRTSQKVVTLATSTGIGPESISNRVRRGEAVDVIMLPDAALSDLIKAGLIAVGSRVPIATSGIGMAVRAGAPKPDISSVDGLRRALLQAKSVAYSAQVSGLYLANELFPKLGIADELKSKSLRVEVERVGAVVARGDAEIGFQQTSELLPIAGIEYVGPLPAEVQRITLFSAGVATGSKNPAGARALIAFFTSPEGVKMLTKYRLDPVSAR
jgi:molybdate transport system substrate-binding protein